MVPAESSRDRRIQPGLCAWIRERCPTLAPEEEKHRAVVWWNPHSRDKIWCGGLYVNNSNIFTLKLLLPAHFMNTYMVQNAPVFSGGFLVKYSKKLRSFLLFLINSIDTLR